MLWLSRFLIAGDVAQFVPTQMTGMLPAGGAAALVPHPCTFVRVRLSSPLHQPLSNWWEWNDEFNSFASDTWCVFCCFLFFTFPGRFSRQFLKRKRNSRKRRGGSGIQMHGSMLSLCTWGWTGGAARRAPPLPPGIRWPFFFLSFFLLWFVAVQVFEGFEFLDEGFVLVLQHGHAVLQTLDVLLLLPATLASCLPVWHRDRESEWLHKMWGLKLPETFNTILSRYNISG